MSRHASQPECLNFYPTALFAIGVLAISHCSTFASPHEPTPKPKACKRAAIFNSQTYQKYYDRNYNPYCYLLSFIEKQQII
jgi:hypothetical protein